MQLSIHLSLYEPSIRPSTYPSICWPFPAMPVVRVSVYLPWRPADVYCDGVEYCSYQYGLHQYWISHSGLAGCPPAAYSNIVSRIVIIGAELWPSGLQATEYSQRKPEKNVFASISPQKRLISFFSERGIWTTEVWEKNVDGFRESACIPGAGRKRRMERWWKAKTQPRPKSGMKACLDLWYMVFFFFLHSPFLSFTLTHTLGSQGNWCAAFDGKERPILTAKRPWWKGWKKESKWVENVLLERMATHDKSLGWSDGNQTSGRWGFDGLTAAEERLR